MHFNTKIGKCPLKVWWSIFLVLQFFVLCTTIASLFLQEWVYSLDSNNYSLLSSENYTISTFNTSLFRGSLTECINGCESTREYEKLKLDWCREPRSVLNSKENQLICELFTNLSKAGKYTIILEGMSLAGLAMWFIATLNYIKRNNRIFFTFFGSLCGCFFLCAACISWFAITGAQARFCSESENEIPLCFSKGPLLIIILAVIYPIILIVYFVVVCIALSKRNEDRRVGAKTNSLNHGKATIQKSPSRPEFFFIPGNYSSFIIQATKLSGQDFIPYGPSPSSKKSDADNKPNDQSIEIKRFENKIDGSQTQILSAYPPAVNYKDYEIGEVEENKDKD